MFNSILRIGELLNKEGGSDYKLPIEKVKSKDAELCFVVFDIGKKKVYMDKQKLVEGDEEKYAYIGNAKIRKPQDRLTTDSLKYIIGRDENGERVPNNKFSLKVVADKLENSKTGKLLKEVLEWYTPETEIEGLDWDCDLYTVRVVTKEGETIDLATLEDYRRSLVEAKGVVKGKCQFCGTEGVLPNPDYTGGSLLKVFITDKKGFLSDFGEVLYSHSVCPSCRNKLELGRSYIEQNLTARVGKLNVYIVPDIPGKAEKTFLDMFKANKEGYILEGLREVERGEREALEIMEFEGVEVRLDLVFGQKEQNKFRLWRVIPEVGVPRLVEIMKLAGKGKRLVSGNNKIPLQDISFQTLYGVLPVRDSGRGIEPKVFLDFLDALLLGNKLDQSYVYGSFVSVAKCVRYGTCENSLTRFTLEDLPLYQEIFIYVMKEIGIMGEKTEQQKETNLDTPLGYADSLGLKGGLKGLFLLGVLTAYVGKEQYNKGDEKKAILNRIDYEGMDIDDVVAFANRLHESLRDYRQLNSVTESLFAEALDLIKRNPNDLWDTQSNVFHILLGYSYQTKMFIQHAKGGTKESNE
ncbi:TM1802 family CRISPR-associated protein [Stygiolobus sp. CP8521M]|uniref:TM1802 family CRISPR-associated protein n=1 Tax=Stygiolobus sp. CP8521M TaxID=3133136 RepID=UPI00307DB78B